MLGMGISGIGAFRAGNRKDKAPSRRLRPPQVGAGTLVNIHQQLKSTQIGSNRIKLCSFVVISSQRGFLPGTGSPVARQRTGANLVLKRGHSPRMPSPRPSPAGLPALALAVAGRERVKEVAADWPFQSRNSPGRPRDKQNGPTAVPSPRRSAILSA